MIPIRSPHGLIQEDVWPNKWLVLVCCFLLNQTSRKQLEKVLPKFIQKWPNAEKFLLSQREEVIAIIKPLGFSNRRESLLRKMTIKFVEGTWSDVTELPGVGEYAARAWQMFCQNELGTSVPNDGALKLYYQWRCLNDQKKNDS